MISYLKQVSGLCKLFFSFSVMKTARKSSCFSICNMWKPQCGGCSRGLWQMHGCMGDQTWAHPNWWLCRPASWPPVLSRFTLTTHTLKPFLSCCHSDISNTWTQTPARTLGHLLLLLIPSTFIKCFALLASTVITIMQMVKRGRENCAKAAHFAQGSPPG